MGKLKSLATGLALGAGGMYAGLQYHVLLAPEGFLMLPRAPQHRLQDVYADIKSWDADNWAARPHIARALTAHGRNDLIGSGHQSESRGNRHRVSETGDQHESPPRSVLPEGEQPADVPAPIPDGKDADPEGKVAEAEGIRAEPGGFVSVTPQADSRSRRNTLPLADLFGFTWGEGRPDRASAGEAETNTDTPVTPTGAARSAEVEFLPPPDAVDLGQPEPFPHAGSSDWRQSDAHFDERRSRHGPRHALQPPGSFD